MKVMKCDEINEVRLDKNARGWILSAKGKWPINLSIERGDLLISMSFVEELAPFVHAIRALIKNLIFIRICIMNHLFLPPYIKKGGDMGPELRSIWILVALFLMANCPSYHLSYFAWAWDQQYINILLSVFL